MSATIDDIISKARELSILIRQSPVAHKYMESRAAVARDATAQRVLERLFLYGEALSKGGSGSTESLSEYNQLKTDLDNSPIVKKHLLNQREYLNFLNSIMDRIKKPRQ